DGSTDRSPAIAREAGARVISLGSNLGRGAARSRALAECSGEFILFCDASNAIAPDFTEKALPHMTSPQTAAVFGPLRPAAATTVAERWRARHLFKVDATDRLETRASLATWSALLRL